MMSTATRITVADYDRMIAEGAFEGGPNRQRIELIDGELRPMSPIGPVHEQLLDRLMRWSCAKTSPDGVSVRAQCSIGIPELDHVPQPDIVWARGRDYSLGRPLAADILLIIEISDSSLDYDRGAKANMFAAAGIADYWVVNIPDRCVEVLRQPKGRRYRSHDVFTVPDKIRPLAFPKLALPLATLFPAG
jgi:Uma2 family endonuclease